MREVQTRFPAAKPVSIGEYDIEIASTKTNDQAVLLALQGDLIFSVERWTRRSSHQVSSFTRMPSRDWGWPVRFIGPAFLYETFRDPVYTHHNGGTFDFRLVNEVKPDLVIIQLAERYLALTPQTPLGF